MQSKAWMELIKYHSCWQNNDLNLCDVAWRAEILQDSCCFWESRMLINTIRVYVFTMSKSNLQLSWPVSVPPQTLFHFEFYMWQIHESTVCRTSELWNTKPSDKHVAEILGILNPMMPNMPHGSILLIWSSISNRNLVMERAAKQKLRNQLRL